MSKENKTQRKQLTEEVADRLVTEYGLTAEAIFQIASDLCGSSRTPFPGMQVLRRQAISARPLSARRSDVLEKIDV